MTIIKVQWCVHDHYISILSLPLQKSCVEAWWSWIFRWKFDWHIAIVVEILCKTRFFIEIGVWVKIWLHFPLNYCWQCLWLACDRIIDFARTPGPSAKSSLRLSSAEFSWSGALAVEVLWSASRTVGISGILNELGLTLEILSSLHQEGVWVGEVHANYIPD